MNRNTAWPNEVEREVPLLQPLSQPRPRFQFKWSGRTKAKDEYDNDPHNVAF
ncbi:MAG TPA: hypothetical protein VFA77_07335 [Candidatus Eisenbacteria bacterium]|nr:hypothetical protein [Candidatus Eisenbacteria bacterium]